MMCTCGRMGLIMTKLRSNLLTITLDALMMLYINGRYSTRVQSVNGEDSHLEKPVSQQTDDVTRHR